MCLHMFACVLCVYVHVYVYVSCVHVFTSVFLFNTVRSEGMTCSICMEVVLSKNPPSEQRFGILSE